MRQKFVAGNWKMFTNSGSARELATGVAHGHGQRQMPGRGGGREHLPVAGYEFISHVISH